MATTEAVGASEARLRELDQRLTMARGEIRQREVELSSAEDLDGAVDGLARVRARADVLTKAREDEVAVLERNRIALARAMASAAQAEAADLFAKYQAKDAALRRAAEEAVRSLLPITRELVALGLGVQDATRRGGPGRIYATQTEARGVAPMVGAILNQVANKVLA